MTEDLTAEITDVAPRPGLGFGLSLRLACWGQAPTLL